MASTVRKLILGIDINNTCPWRLYWSITHVWV